jgi:hypothetical protein
MVSNFHVHTHHNADDDDDDDEQLRAEGTHLVDRSAASLSSADPGSTK